MKKLLLTALAVIIMLSAVIIMPNAVSAATKTNKTFYPVSHTLCGNSYGYVTLNSNSLMLVQKSKDYKKSNVSYIEINGECRYVEALTFFMRGKTVIYNDGACTYSINLDGTNRKELTKQKKFSTSYLLGGYGSDIIVYGYAYPDTSIYKVNTAGKMTKLIKVSNKYGQFNMFGSKIYCSPYKDEKGKTKVYNLKTNKTTTVSRINSLTYGKKNMYYINKNNNLIRVDLNDKKKTVAKNVHNILDANNGSTVIYSKLNKSKNEVYYKQSGEKKGKKISTREELAKKVVSAFNKHEKHFCKKKIKTSLIRGYDVNAKIVGKRIAFSVYTCEYHTPIILSLNINGGTFRLEKSTECKGGNYEDDDYYDPDFTICVYHYCNLESVGNTLAVRFFDEYSFYGVKFEKIA